MKTKKILENELFVYATKKLDYKTWDDLSNQYSETDINKINLGLAEFLKEQTGEIEIEPVTIEANNTNYKSIIFKSTKDGSTKTLALFSFKNLFLESWLAWIGITVAVFHPSPEMGISIAEIAKSCWSNFKRLRRPEDDNQIDIVEKILQLKAANKSKGNKNNPTTKEIKASLPDMPNSAFENSLHKLLSNHIIEISKKDSDNSEVTDTNNQWKIKL